MECIGCDSSAVTERRDRTAQGYRRFRCRGCGRQFNERSAGVLNRACLPSAIIAIVVFCRVFLADIGVGTIDQALLGVLMARNAGLRLFALARKVLVVDEAHAFDSYMNEELDRLLTFHALLGGSSIVLSATLPRVRRAALAAAHTAGLGLPPPMLRDDAYPLITVIGEAGLAEHPTDLRDALRRDLPITRLDSEAGAVARLLQAARAGACGIWIRNTVEDARRGLVMLVIPEAFQVVAAVEKGRLVLDGMPVGDPVSAVRRRCRDTFRRADVLARLIPAIEDVLAAGGLPVPSASEEAMPVAIPPPEASGDAGHRG